MTRHLDSIRSRLLPWLLIVLLTGCAGTPTPGVVQPSDLQINPQNSHVQPLTDGLTPDQVKAQNIALNSEALLTFTRDPASKAPLRSAVFGVYPIQESDITADTAACRSGACYRVDVYNYATNTTYHAWVDIRSGQTVHVSSLADAQPDLPPYLVQRAVDIAIAAPEVKAALGFDPGADRATMANMKTALNRTACERSRHLCVAPTFMVGERALWAIVDLTDEKLVGVRWTNVGKTKAAGSITQQTVENQAVFENYCQKTNSLERDGWRMDYILTSSDGLRLSDVTFQGEPVLVSLKQPDWHVSYSGTDGFGYSDAVGCPIFSQAAVGAHSGPTVEDIILDGEVIGFAVVQDFYHPDWPLPCNYRYQQRIEFHKDGSFRSETINLGRGCGDNGTYRPVQRIHLQAPAGSHFTFEEWNGTTWVPWEVEGWRLQDATTQYTPEGYQYRVVTPDGRGFYIMPGNGQFGDGGRGDNAYVYVTKYKPDEGDADLITIGPCCNDDYQQGPEKFIDNPPESLRGSDIVLWYVAQMHNDDDPGREYCWADLVIQNGVYVPRVYPCIAGPLFVPIR